MNYRFRIYLLSLALPLASCVDRDDAEPGAPPGAAGSGDSAGAGGQVGAGGGDPWCELGCQRRTSIRFVPPFDSDDFLVVWSPWGNRGNNPAIRCDGATGRLAPPPSELLRDVTGYCTREGLFIAAPRNVPLWGEMTVFRGADLLGSGPLAPPTVAEERDFCDGCREYIEEHVFTIGADPCLMEVSWGDPAVCRNPYVCEVCTDVAAGCGSCEDAECYCVCTFPDGC